MADLTKRTAQALDARRVALAEAIVARQYELQPELRGRYGEAGRAKCVQDTAYHLAYLSASLGASSTTLFADYLAWAKAVLVARNVRFEDVESTLACMRELLPQLLPGETGTLAAHYLEAALTDFPQAPTDLPTFLAGDDPLSHLARQCLDALLNGRRHHACRLVLAAVRQGVALPAIYLQVLQRCQREVGRLWQLNRISVAQEHYCSAAAQLIMSQLYPDLFAVPKKGRRLVATAVGGELHEIGLRVVTDLLEMDGWDTLYLGADVPTPGVVQTLGRHRADVLVISATMAFHLPAVEELIAAVRSSEVGGEVKVMVGGYPFNVVPDLWRRVGADGWAADAAAALDTANRLLDIREPRRAAATSAKQAVQVSQESRSPGAPPPEGEPALYEEMSRLNNELLTAQRELARQNAQLQRLNERLVEADERKDEFLAMLAHELRNPLAPLRNAAHLLQQPGVGRPLIERTGEMVGRQVQQLGRLVDDLLDLSRIARGKMQLRKEWVDLGQAVERAAEASRPLVEARHHDLNVSLPTPPVPLRADPTRLEQILTNLLNNAARYTPEGGRIWLTAAREGDEITVRVRDTGIGIPPDMLPKIFGLFAQVERPQERAGGGLGIGLALVKSLAEMHGGRVEAHSAGPGRGSEFVVRWPLPTEEAPAIVKAPSEAAPGTERAVRVLLVDDNVEAAESLALLLRLWGHEVAVALDGPAALRAAAEHRPEVALLDIGLPSMDGYELARRLRRQPGTERAVLVALTGWGQEEDKHRSREAGFDHHLVKPVDLSDLQELLVQAKPQPAPS